mmetsp:Transcript_21412/g.36570  ORF Transcript_21412/g.36570 Transcript_21412/m.36570 type:complete len:83 (-) Transcript_21412:99-347(-)
MIERVCEGVMESNGRCEMSARGLRFARLDDFERDIEDDNDDADVVDVDDDNDFVFEEGFLRNSKTSPFKMLPFGPEALIEDI